MKETLMHAPRRAGLALLLIPVLTASAGALRAGEPSAEMISDPKYRPSKIRQRGKSGRWDKSLPPGGINRTAVWGWRLKLPDGRGLAFGGLQSWDHKMVDGKPVRVDDPRIHTSLFEGGKWKPIYDRLRKTNPLQPHHDRLIALRRPLHHVTSLARHIYLEGQDATAEKTCIDRRIAPRLTELIGKLKKIRSALAKAKGADAYHRGQVACAQKHLDRVLPPLEKLGTRTSREKLAALRVARIHLEQAAEALHCEPPPRVLSMLAYDAKTGLYALWGGDHFDFLYNDLWVFDVKKMRWMQRHPKAAPEPRANHILEGNGKGQLVMRGGYLYYPGKRIRGWDSDPYLHAGPGDWIYDLAADTWRGPTGAKTFPPDTRGYRTGAHLPDHHLQGARPDAAAHGKRLKNIPANTWVDLKPPRKFAGNRDWGTLGFDAERGVIYFYNGGHSAYGGTDVAHYHLATNRWDQLVETELPVSMYQASGCSMPGRSFNRRPWITNHLWNSYGYHPGLKKLVVAGRFTSSCFPRGQGQPDKNTYVYDPDLGDWEKRVPNAIPMSCMGAQILHVPGFGMIEWGSWRLDEKTLAWQKLAPKGKLPGPGIDFCGLVHDAKRKRVLYFSGGTYGGKPYSGRVFAMGIPSLNVSSFTPQGSEHIGALYAGGKKKRNMLGTWVLREVIYHPKIDMFIFSSRLPGGYMAALDAKGKRWVGLKLPGPYPMGLSSALAYDSKRDLVYSVGTRADVSALRLDPKTLVVKTLAEIAAERKKNGKAGK